MCGVMQTDKKSTKKLRKIVGNESVSYIMSAESGVGSESVSDVVSAEG